MPTDTQIAQKELTLRTAAHPGVPQSGSQRLHPIVGVAYAATIFLSAFLLFQVQLIVGKYILPSFGGAPAVWTTCLVFFQVLLLLGYAYAHFVSNHPRLSFQGRMHVGVLFFCFAFIVVLWLRWDSPLTPGPEWLSAPGTHPVWRIFELLSITAALPFFVLSTTGPLLQSWFSHSYPGQTPYRLYAVSNTGSLLGVLSYPFLLEWALTTKHQASLWSICFVLFSLIASAIALQLPKISIPGKTDDCPFGEDSSVPKYRSFLMWFALSACSSTMLLATTSILCQDVAAIPLLWVLPLVLYLGSFILTFANGRWYSRALFWPLYSFALALGLKVDFQGRFSSVPKGVAIFSAVLFVVCMICHGELNRSKPRVQHLTSFYLMIALGGAAGAVSTALIAPRIFVGFWEFRIALVSCGFLLFLAFTLENSKTALHPAVWSVSFAILVTFLVQQVAILLSGATFLQWLNNEYYAAIVALIMLGVFLRLHKLKAFAIRDRLKGYSPWQPSALLGLFAICGVLAYGQTIAPKHILLRERNFFGAKSVISAAESIRLQNGSTLHGGELRDPKRRNTPTVYFHKKSGIGLLLDNYPRGISRPGSSLRVGIIGLGVGTLAAYGQPLDQFRYYEIDPAVIQLSLVDRPYFHFLQDSQATVTIVPGDGRLSLQRELSNGELQDFDVMVLDAFSGDAIPVHLLTKEAVGVYLRHLHGPDSVLAFHISNAYLDLRPVVQGLCDFYHLQAIEVRDSLALWILASQNPAMLRLPHLADQATAVTLVRKPVLWTDDYSNLLLVLKRSK
jgi:spermidine synthase